jgi:hypothetical protein
MLVQTSDHFGMNQCLSGPGQEVHQDPTWLAIFQNQSFPGPSTQMPPSIAILVTINHISAPSPTSASHVSDGSTSSTNNIDSLHPTSNNYVGGTIIFSLNHSHVMSPASIHHTRDDSISPASYIKNHRRLRCKPKFFYRTCEGNHLTRLCLITAEIPEAWGSPKSPSNSKASMVSLHTTSPLIASVVPPMQSSPDLTPFVKGEASLSLVTMHHLQPIMEEVATPMQSLVNPVGRLVVVIVNPSHGFWTARLMKVFRHEGKCTCRYNTHGWILYIMVFPVVCGMSRGSSWLRRNEFLKMTK